MKIVVYHVRAQDKNIAEDIKDRVFGEAQGKWPEAKAENMLRKLEEELKKSNIKYHKAVYTTYSASDYTVKKLNEVSRYRAEFALKKVFFGNGNTEPVMLLSWIVPDDEEDPPSGLYGFLYVPVAMLTLLLLTSRNRL